MSLEQLAVSGFRNLSDAGLELDPGINLLWGPNGAGKSSLLEAVYFLGRVRSFRARDLGVLVQRGSSQCVVSGRVADRAGRRHQLGVGYSPAGVRARVDGREVSSLSELAPLLPVEVINSESQSLLSGPPGERRRLIAWGVFHVEPDYGSERRKYDRALRQRNAALRQADLRLARSWEPELAARGERIDSLHRSYLEQLRPEWDAATTEWLPDMRLEWRYRSGWRQEDSLAGSLVRARSRDQEAGHTTVGPHRADLLVLAGERRAGDTLSRGQQKLGVMALRLAQLRVAARVAMTPVLLLDDLGAELDRERRQQVLRALAALEAQVLVTAVEEREVPEGWARRVFHVEQGRYRRVI